MKSQSDAPEDESLSYFIAQVGRSKIAYVFGAAGFVLALVLGEFWSFFNSTSHTLAEHDRLSTVTLWVWPTSFMLFATENSKWIGAQFVFLLLSSVANGALYFLIGLVLRRCGGGILNLFVKCLPD